MECLHLQILLDFQDSKTIATPTTDAIHAVNSTLLNSAMTGAVNMAVIDRDRAETYAGVSHSELDVINLVQHEQG